MKAFAMTLILIAVIGGIAPLLLPKGEKSPLYGALRLLSALAVLTVLIRPVLQFFSLNNQSFDESLTAADEKADYDPELLLLRRSEAALEKNIRKAFPDGFYEVIFEEDTENRVITKIRIETEDVRLGDRISAWLMQNGLADP